MIKEINILFDGPPEHQAGRFVDVIDENGKGIRVGEWIKMPGSMSEFWILRITPLAFYTVEEIEKSQRMLGEVDSKQIKLKNKLQVD